MYAQLPPQSYNVLLVISSWAFPYEIVTFLNHIMSRISAPGSKQKCTSDDRDSALVALLQEKSWGRLGPQWIRPNPPRLHILDGEVTYSAKSCIFIPVLLLI